MYENWEARMIRIWENCAVSPGRHFVFVEESQLDADITLFSWNLGRHVAFVVGRCEDADQSTVLYRVSLFCALRVPFLWKQTRGSFFGAILFLLPQARRMQTWDILSDLLKVVGKEKEVGREGGKGLFSF